MKRRFSRRGGRRFTEKRGKIKEKTFFFKKYKNIQSLDRKAVVTLIEQIIVYSKEQIEIQFKYSDEMQEMIEAVQIIRERQERKGEFVCGA